MLKNIPTHSQEFIILGPAPAILSKLRGQYRYRFLVQGPKKTMLQPFILKWLETSSAPPYSVKVTIDVDPLTLI